MSAFTDNFDRRVIPRWRDTTTASDGTMMPLLPRQHIADFANDILRVSSELESDPSPAVAVDALNVALLTQDKTLEKAALAILNSTAGLPPAVLRLTKLESTGDSAQACSTEATGNRSETGIRNIRRLLQQYPKNPLLFLDLARHHAILGHDEKARLAAVTALALAPAHRLVLRSVARYFINAGQEDEAHRVLARAPATKHDPWLIAAELAVAQETKRSPRFWREGKSMLESRAHLPANLSELASAVGTWEVLEGNQKKARKHFDLALIAPTENALAQAKWAEKRTPGTFNMDQWLGQLPCAHEALFMQAYQENDLHTAARHAALWYYAEPFSANAAMTASYVCSLLDDHDTVLAMTRTALVSHPDNGCLDNNMIFALISSGHFFEQEEAAVMRSIKSVTRRLLNQISAKDGNTAHAAANLGLLAYRCGHLEEGRTAYDYAIKWSRDRKEPFPSANAALFHAREAILAHAPWAEAVMLQAKESCSKVQSAGLTFYMEKLQALAKAPEKAADILCPTSGKLSVSNKPIAIPKFEVRKGADGLLTMILPKKN